MTSDDQACLGMFFEGLQGLRLLTWHDPPRNVLLEALLYRKEPQPCRRPLPSHSPVSSLLWASGPLRVAAAWATAQRHNPNWQGGCGPSLCNMIVPGLGGCPFSWGPRDVKCGYPQCIE